MLRKKMALGLGLVMLAICLAGCAQKEKKRFQTAWLDLFDTVTTALGYEEDEETFRKNTERFYQEMELYDHLYDIYHEYPGLVNLCTVNSHPGETFTVDQRIIDLLTLAREIDGKTGHRTDAAFGAVLRIWHEARTLALEESAKAELPAMENLREAEKHTGFQFLEMDPEARTVRLTDPQASLDVGALAKGYAIQRACEVLPSGYLINAGGNVAATGPKPQDGKWVIGIRDPDADADTFLYRVEISRGSVVTSGDYERYFTVDGVRYHHIIDPETLFPGRKWRSVTVISPDSGTGDALSTSLFLMDQAEGAELAASLGAEAMWIAPDGSEYFTPGFKQYLIP